MTLKEAAKLFIEKHKADRIDVDYIEREFGSVESYLKDEGQYDTDLASANTYIEINAFDSKSGNPEIIEWFQTEWQVTYYDLPKSERKDQRDWTLRESFDNDFNNVINYVKRLYLEEGCSDITLTRWENGNPVAEEDWTFYLNEEPWTEVPNEDVKTLIDSPTWRDLINDIASFHVEESALDDIWEEDEHGSQQYTEDAQNKYNFACDAAEKMIGQYFIRDDDDL